MALSHSPRCLAAPPGEVEAHPSASPAGGTQPDSSAAPPTAAAPNVNSSASGIRLDPTWVLDTGRAIPPPRQSGLLRLTTHGEYQIRMRYQTPVVLVERGSDPSSTRLEQGARLNHWLRLTPVFEVGTHARLVAQADLPHGLIAGPPNRYVTAAREPWSERQPLRAELRWLFAEWTASGFELRVGQQPTHWGLGLVENDGDHPPRFGDYVDGTRVERVGIAIRPGGSHSTTEARLAGDLVYSDPLAELREEEVAWRGVFAVEHGLGRELGLGLLVIGRHQRSRLDGALDPEARRELALVTADITGRAASPLPGGSATFFAEFEVAMNHGDWDLGAAVPGADTTRLAVRSHGASVRAGTVVTKGDGLARWGRFVTELEWGWASGDADPYDAIDHRFRFAPAHRVGILLFQEVLAWKTARSATIADDGSLGPHARPEGSDLATNGGVAGATYLAPVVVVRPVRTLDLKAGAVIAQATADVVDPVRVYTDGRYVNFDGGTPRAHDLGMELDAGLELRIPLPTGICLQLGAEGAAFFPGYAFANTTYARNPTAVAANSRIGIQF